MSDEHSVDISTGKKTLCAKRRTFSRWSDDSSSTLVWTDSMIHKKQENSQVWGVSQTTTKKIRECENPTQDIEDDSMDFPRQRIHWWNCFQIQEQNRRSGDGVTEQQQIDGEQANCNKIRGFRERAREEGGGRKSRKDSRWSELNWMSSQNYVRFFEQEANVPFFILACERMPNVLLCDYAQEGREGNRANDDGIFPIFSPSFTPCSAAAAVMCSLSLFVIMCTYFGRSLTEIRQ